MKIRRIAVVLLLAVSLLITGLGNVPADASVPKTLTLAMAKNLAVANSTAIEKLESSLETKKVSKAQAIRSIKEKKKSLSSFRWSPLLNFKFPTDPNLSEEYEFEFKPTQIQSQIDSIQHQLTDQVLAEYETVSNLYVDIVVAEESISFNESRLSAMNTVLEKNRARLLIGLANQSDIDSMEKSIKTLTQKISSDKRNYEAKKKKLTNKIGMDVTSNYRFINPFKEANIERSQLSSITQYTLDNDQTYYDASLTAETSMISLQTNYSLMENQYGGDISLISSYVQQAINGEKINKKAFKKKYDEFLKVIDAPWQGKKHIIWFVYIPREWFKGETDGIRYVEDEPYALYEAALEYQDALLEKNSTRDDVIEQVEDGFNNYVSVRNAYLLAKDNVETAKTKLASDEILNHLGELTYEEYQTEMDDYEEQQNDLLAAYGDYTQTLYSYDRLTCGAITKLLEGTSADLDSSASGESYIEETDITGAYYYIENIVQEEEFKVGVSIPDDFAVTITDFELWCDNVQIGSRTAIDSTIRHLALARDGVNEVKLRFYNNGTFVDECVIDTSVYSGPLSIKTYQVKEPDNSEIGTYTVTEQDTTGLVSITMNPNPEEGIGYYLIKTKEGKTLVSDVMTSIDKEFQYLSLLQPSIGDLTLEFYNKDKEFLYKGYFDVANQKIKKK